MNCRHCGYALWNLSTNACPECGTTFDLRTYRFEPGSVVFACPVCDHRYQGHGPNYVPSEAEEVQCLHCGQTVPTAFFRVVPLRADVVAADPQRVPWDERRPGKFWSAWWETWKLACFQPAVLGRQLGTVPDVTQAVWFAGVTHGLASLGNVAMYLVVAAVSLITQPGRAGWSPLLGGVPFFAGWFFTIIWMVVAVFSAHLFVAITGPKRGGFSITARALCFAQAPYLLGIIPLAACMPMLTVIWYLVVGTITLREAQRISTLRALLATSWLFIGGVILVFLLIAIGLSRI